MTRVFRLALIVVVAVLFVPARHVTAANSASIARAAADTTAPAFHRTACPPDVFPASERVDCGYVVVPEDRAQRTGRTIQVAAALVHAPSGHPKSDPIVFLDGGPSIGAINTFPVDFYFSGASYAQDHDIVLVDTRGTGLSVPQLGCPEVDDAYVAAFYSRPFVNSQSLADVGGALKTCHDRLASSGIDLRAYNSEESAADLDALRRALGYRQWDLVAISADGVLGLTYMRLFPDGIRSAIIDSGQSTQFLPRLDDQRGYAEQLDAIFAGCASNTACAAAYPDLRDVFYGLVRQLQAHPVTVTMPGFQPHPVSVRIDGAGFYLDAVGEIFPGNEFGPDSIHALMSEIWRSAHGQLTEVYRERFGTGPVTNDHAGDVSILGKTMSYVCRDEVDFITPTDLSRAASDIPALAPIFLDPNYDLANGDTNVESPAGCRIWNVGVADPSQHQPVTSSIPTLVLVGEFDPVAAYIVRQIPPTLSNSFYYEFPAAAHLQLASFNFDSDCARSIAGQFLANPRARPDGSCIAALTPFDFTP
jgi:pimeloyl-ACP methyl ester carboxylesterase